MNGGGKDMAVIRIGQHKRWDQALESGYGSADRMLVHQITRAFELRARKMWKLP